MGRYVEGEDWRDAMQALKGRMLTDPDRDAKRFQATMSVIKHSLQVSLAATNLQCSAAYD